MEIVIHIFKSVQKKWALLEQLFWSGHAIAGVCLLRILGDWATEENETKENLVCTETKLGDKTYTIDQTASYAKTTKQNTICKYICIWTDKQNGYILSNLTSNFETTQ